MGLIKKGGIKGSKVLHQSMSLASTTSEARSPHGAAAWTASPAVHGPAAQSEVLPSGTVLQQRYAVESVLGAGGMSVVYRGRDLRFKDVVRMCAIKESFQSDPDPQTQQLRLEHFAREAGLLATLNHPAIPKVYDFFEERGKAYLVIELVAGHDLQTMLDHAGQPFTQQQVGVWALQICEVLQYLHSHTPEPIIFRDLKPSNIMIMPGDRVVLIDFGIARAFQDHQVRGTIIGSEGYAPPEQYRGFTDARGDIYALGATLHQLLTNTDPRGEPPFTFHERPIRQFNAAVSLELEALVNQMLAYEPDQRPQSAAELTALLQTVPTLRGINVSYDTVKLVADTPGSSVKPSATELVWRFPCADEVRSSPTVHNGTVYVGSYDRHVYALDADTGALQWKYATMRGVSSSPAVRDDLLVVGSEDGSVYALDARKGTPRWSLRTERAVRSSPRIADRIIYVGSDDQHVYAIDSTQGRVLWKYRTWMAVRSSCTVGPGLLVVGSSDGHVYALDPLHGTLLWKYRTPQGIVSSPTVGAGLVFVGSMDNNMYALGSEHGNPVWRFRTGHHVNASPTLADGRLFIGSVDGKLYALEARTGQPVWQFTSGGQITSSARVVNGKVYVGSTDGNLHCLDAATGEERWSYQTDGPVVSSPAVADDVVFFGSLDRHIYALKA